MNKIRSWKFLALALTIISVTTFMVIQGCGSESYTVDSAPANFADPISINDGAAVTGVTAVTLTLNATATAGGNVKAYFVSENSTDPLPGDAGWVDITPIAAYHATGIPFTLSAGYATKTVYVWYKYADDSVSAAASDSILYQFVPSGC
jgi:hypothetical protein